MFKNKFKKHYVNENTREILCDIYLLVAETALMNELMVPPTPVIYRILNKKK